MYSPLKATNAPDSTGDGCVDGDGVLIELSKVVPGTRYIIEASADLRIYRKVATIDPEEVEPGLFVYDPQRFQRAKYYRVRLEALEVAE